MSASLSIRRAAADVLKLRIEQCIPALNGRTRATFADEEENRPEGASCALVFKRAGFEPQQSAEVLATEGAGPLVLQLGEWAVRAQIIVGAGSSREREALEEALLGLWLTDPDRPGVLVLPITDAPAVSEHGPVSTGATVIATFVLDDDEFNEERVFSKKRDSVLGITVELPALLRVASVPSLETIRTTIESLRIEQPFVETLDTSA